METRVSALPRGTALARFCIALGLSRGKDNLHAYEISKQWRDTPQVEATFKAMVDPGGLTTWGAELAMYGIGAELISALLPITILGRLQSFVRKTPFRAKTPRATSVAASAWVGDGLPIPSRKASFDLVTQEAAKVASLVVLSKDLLRFSTPSAEASLRDQLVKGAAAYADTQLLDMNVSPIFGVRPGALTWQCDTVTETGNSAAQILGDLLALIGKLTSQGCVFQNCFWIMRPSTAAFLASRYTTAGGLAFPNVRATPDGGFLLGFPILNSASSPQQITLVDAAEILLSDEGGAELTATDEAALAMDDDLAQSPVVKLTSLWQNDLWALRCVREIAWQMARSTGDINNSPTAFQPQCISAMTVNY